MGAPICYSFPPITMVFAPPWVSLHAVVDCPTVGVAPQKAEATGKFRTWQLGDHTPSGVSVVSWAIHSACRALLVVVDERRMLILSWPRAVEFIQGAVFMKNSYNGKAIPAEGTAIGYRGGELQVPDRPIIPFIEGDGTGRDIWKASRRVFDAAVEQAYGGKRRVAWFEVFAGEKAFNTFKEWLPNDTVEAIRDFRVAIKGPLTTPVGGGIRSLNVALRQVLDLYSCERPVRYFVGVPSPVREPEKMDVFIFARTRKTCTSGSSGSPEPRRQKSFSNS